jgi:hypothetical protein
MGVITVRTDDPSREQWRVLLQFSYEQNIRRAFTDLGHPDPESQLLEHIAGMCRQAHGYFMAASTAPLDISPLLLYYGTSNLLAAVVTLRSGRIPAVVHHGMRLEAPAIGAQIGDSKVLVSASPQGALMAFADLLDPKTRPLGGQHLSLREVLAGIPDIASSYDWPYGADDRLTLPLSVVRREHETVERIDIRAFNGASPIDVLRRVPGFDRGYLRPQVRHDYVILYPRVEGDDVGTYGVLGDKYLVMGTLAKGTLVRPAHALAYFMALYVLGTLSRYHAGVWHRFVRADVTAERATVERLVETAGRLVPRLALEALHAARWEFNTRSTGVEDVRERLSVRDVEHLIRNERDRFQIFGADTWEDEENAGG